MIFAKGHGTQNDFVVLPDLSARLELAPAAVAALCDRRRGLGADGVLRVTTGGAAVAAGVLHRLPEGVESGDWFMDYRNADGSTAQMCGNGVRVFAHYLRVSGLEARDEFVIGSLAGPRPVVVHHADDVTAEVTVEMGKVTLLGTGTATVGGRHLTGVAIDVGNPHLACLVPDLTADELDALDLTKTAVTNGGMIELQAVPFLQSLALRDTQISDTGLERLAKLTLLETLWLDHTRVTKPGVRALQEVLPKCRIFAP